MSGDALKTQSEDDGQTEDLGAEGAAPKPRKKRKSKDTSRDESQDTSPDDTEARVPESENAASRKAASRKVGPKKVSSKKAGTKNAGTMKAGTMKAGAGESGKSADRASRDEGARNAASALNDHGAPQAEGTDNAAHDTGRDAATDGPDSADSAELTGLPSGVSLASVVEAVLLSTDVALSAGKIAQIVGTGDARDIREIIDQLNRKYEQADASFRIESIAKGYQILTLPEYGHWVGQVHATRAESRLTPAALETLAIVAYKQPLIRADIESIRGVACGEMLVRLRELNLVKIVGRAEEIGRPLLYGTTRRFLEIFGLSSLKDLPKVDEQARDGVPLLRPVTSLEDLPDDSEADEPAAKASEVKSKSTTELGINDDDAEELRSESPESTAEQAEQAD